MASQEVAFCLCLQSKYIIDLLVLEHNYSAACLSSLLPVLMSPGESFRDMYARGTRTQ